MPVEMDRAFLTHSPPESIIQLSGTKNLILPLLAGRLVSDSFFLCDTDIGCMALKRQRERSGSEVIGTNRSDTNRPAALMRLKEWKKKNSPSLWPIEKQSEAGGQQLKAQKASSSTRHVGFFLNPPIAEELVEDDCQEEEVETIDNHHPQALTLEGKAIAVIESINKDFLTRRL